MKSKVILFCVLLFCSKFVDSVPHSEELVRQRAFQPTNWPANKQASGQYVDTNFAQTQNGNVLKNAGLQLENNQDYFVNQRTRGFESQGYKDLASSLIGKERIQNYAPSVEKDRVNSYPVRSHSYSSSPAQIELEDQQYGFQNWRSQNQYTNSAPIREVFSNNDRPSVTTVQEPYRGPVQYVKSQYNPTVNRRHQTVDRFYPAREQLQYPIDNTRSVSTKYVQNAAPLSVARESLAYDNYGNVQATASNKNARIITNKQFFASESGSPYNGAPDVVSSDILPEQSGNIGYEYSQSDSVNTADVTTFDNNSQNIPVADSYNTENRASTLLPVENKRETAAIIKSALAEKPLVHRYAHNYRPDSNWNNFAREGSYNGASAGKSNSFVQNSGNVNNNYESDFVPNQPSPIINTYSKRAPSPADANLNLAHENNEDVSQYGYTTPAPLGNSNSEDNFYQELASGIHKYDLKNIASHPKIKDLLAVNTKPYVLIHANGSVEYFDKFDFDAKENSKYHLIHTKHTIAKPQGTQSDKVIKPQPPVVLPTSTTPVPSQLANDENSQPIPISSNEWLEDDSTYGNQHEDDKTSQQSSLYRKQHDADNYSTSPYPQVNHPVGDDDSNPTFLNVNQPQDDSHTKSLVTQESQASSGDQSENVDNKPTAYVGDLNSDIVNQPDNGSTPKSLISKDTQSNTHDVSITGTINENQSDKSTNDNDVTKSTSVNLNQQDGDITAKKLASNNDKQSLVENQFDNDDLTSAPIPDDSSTPKPVLSQFKQSVITGDDSKTVLSNVNQSDNDNSNNPQSSKANLQDNDDFSSDNIKWSDDSSKPLSSKYLQSPNRDDSNPLSSGDNNPHDNDDKKPQELSSKDSHPIDGVDDSSLTSNVNGKNYQSSPKEDNQSPNDRDDSISSLSKVNQSDDDSNTKNVTENSPVDDNKQKSSTADSVKIDNNPTPTTSSPNPLASDKNTASAPLVESTPGNKDNPVILTTASPDVTTLYADTTPEDGIITISPIELATDNVSDAPVVTTTETHHVNHVDTIQSRIESESKKDSVQNGSTAPSADSDKKQTSTQDSQSSLDSQNGNYTVVTNENDTQKNSKNIVSQTTNEKNDSKTAMYNSLANTDVPAESDDYSPVTPSIRIDVNTGDDVNASPGDNPLEQSETDVKITVSAIDDSEDDIIAIDIDVSESAGDSSRDDKSVVIRVNTNDGSGNDSVKTSKAADFENNKTNKDDNTNKNIEIDMANIEGEPTMWIRTTNQDFIEKLASKNETQFDIIYFFNMNNQPLIEREKVTTIHCNGTVVIEQSETSYANKNDKTPKIVKTTTILQIEDYEP